MEIEEIKKIIVDQKEEIILTNPRRLSNEKQGSAKQVLILRLKEFFKKKDSQYHIEMVFIYGSYASGYPRIDSDIDLGILFDARIESPDEIFSLITALTYELDKELNKEVNIISILRDFSKPMLYYNAIVLGTPVFVKNNNQLLSLKLEAIHQMEDFQLFGIPLQQHLAQKLLRR